MSWLRAGQRPAARARDLLDGAVIATSLLAVSWTTTLSAIQAEGAGGTLAFVLSLAYPVGDVVMGTLVLLALSRPGAVDRATLALIAGGLGSLAVADSAYVYLMGVGDYGTGDLVSAGWVVGFLLIAAGARADRSGAGRDGAAVPARTAAPHHPGAPSRAALALPYIPLLLAGSAVLAAVLEVPGRGDVEIGLGVALVLLVGGRQFLALAENRRLVLALAQARDDLRHQALHDPLTGLPNRALFIDRLHQALARHADAADTRPPAPGPTAAPRGPLLRPRRLQGRQRPPRARRRGRAAAHGRPAPAGRRRPRATVARLGGDEFAVLLDDGAAGADPERVADRLVRDVAAPYDLPGGTARVSVSIGIARASTAARPAGTAPSDVDEAARLLLHDADVAMYSAKATTKRRARPDAHPVHDEHVVVHQRGASAVAALQAAS